MAEGENPAGSTSTQAAPSDPREDAWTALAGLPCALSAALRVPGFRVRDLLDLETGSVIATDSSSADPVAVWVNGVKIGLAEFDLLGTGLALRMKELE